MNKPHHRIVAVAALSYLAVVALVVFWPAPVDRPTSGQLQQIFDWLHHHGMPIFIGYKSVEFMANIAMFVPMGYIASIWFKKVRLGIVIGALASCVVEVCQAVFLPERFATGLDVLANTIGATVGGALYCVVHRRRWLGLPKTEKYPMKKSER